MSRPEHIAPAAVYYSVENAEKYAENTRNLKIQNQMTERALQLLLLSDPLDEKLVLDLGCGTGMSSATIASHGITFIGSDLSDSMLRQAVEQENGEGGDFLVGDMGSPMAFRDGIFDGCVSVSALQWMLNADGGEKYEPYKRLKILFTCLRRVLRRGARAVFQFYPESAEQVEMITSCAIRCGFGGGVVVDFPHSTRAKKTYLVVHTGFQGASGQVSGTMDVGQIAADGQPSIQDRIANVNRARNHQRRSGTRKEVTKSKSWVMKKKERQRKQGKYFKTDSKYTGRKRKDRF
jgi:18S rRNA (guanine1575-N7)-methyltransferase